MVMDWGTRELGVLKPEDDDDDFVPFGVPSSRPLDDSEIFDDISLSYINEMLMEEEIDDKLSIGDTLIPLNPFLVALEDGDSRVSVTEPVPLLPPPDFQLLDEIKLVEEYRRGVEEASKFLPSPKLLHFEEERKSSRAREKDNDEDEEEERWRRRSRRQVTTTAAIVVADKKKKEEVPSELFDRVLLNDAVCDLQRTLQSQVKTKTKMKSKGGGGGRRRVEEEVVDLRTLLVQCAQAVAADDQRAARELLQQVRAGGSATGDGAQRLAVCLADGLEARLAGTGTRIYQTLVARTQSGAALLKAYHLYLAACPFKRISHFFANQTILDAAAGRRRLHVIDFGIYLGFQWPCLIQRLAMRPGGPPALRITGVELPQPAFRPAERVDETGLRLKRYAEMFGVPFEYRPVVAACWEDITPADLGVTDKDKSGQDDDEVIVVNCLYRFRNVADEAREKVVRRIGELRPAVFVHGVVNGAYGAPFFVTRFREALFHFSALFDMLDATMPKEHPERMLIEREIFGKEAINVVACEGTERVERPETYRQWQARNARAGLVQLPLSKGVVGRAREKVAECYDKDFLIGEEGGWLVQGWKGRIIYAISTWCPSSTGPSPSSS